MKSTLAAAALILAAFGFGSATQQQAVASVHQPSSSVAPADLGWGGGSGGSVVLADLGWGGGSGGSVTPADLGWGGGTAPHTI